MITRTAHALAGRITQARAGRTVVSISDLVGRRQKFVLGSTDHVVGVGHRSAGVRGMTHQAVYARVLCCALALSLSQDYSIQYSPVLYWSINRFLAPRVNHIAL